MQTADSTVPGTSDRECLESWARHRDADGLRTLVERYLVFVYSSALRRTGDAAQAAEVTRAVFLVLARRARRLRKNTVLAGWLFHVTAVACRKLRQKRMGRLGRLWQWISRKPRPALPPDATLWTTVIELAKEMSRALSLSSLRGGRGRGRGGPSCLRFDATVSSEMPLSPTLSPLVP